MSIQYDVAIIGSGPGGYVAAIRSAQLDGKVCVIEKDSLGGVCLNWGCIPTKFLLHSVELACHLKQAPNYGVEISGYKMDFKKAIEQKNKIVSNLRSGIQMLFKARSINLVKGTGRLIDKNTISVDGSPRPCTQEGGEKISAKNIIIATGSRPIQLEFLKFDSKDVLSSDDIFNLDRLPQTILIIGGGVIGCEFANIFCEFGSKVTVVEAMESILPNEDKEISKRLQIFLKKKGITIKTNTKIKEFKKTPSGLVSITESAEHLISDKILLCIGRMPNADNLGIEELGIKTQKNSIIVDKNLRTNIPNIYAIGDVVAAQRPMLAHVASYEGIVASENIFGRQKEVDYSAIPACTFTEPQIGSVGLTEQRARVLGFDIKIGKFPFTASGKARVLGQTEGLVKIITDSKTGKILGAHIIGPDAAELIAILTVALKTGITAEQLADTVIAHPTLSESIIETARSIYGGAIHAL